MYINTKATLDVVIDLCLDNLNYDDITKAKELGDLFRQARYELTNNGRFSKETIDKLGCCTYVEDESGTYVDTFEMQNLHLLEQK